MSALDAVPATPLGLQLTAGPPPLGRATLEPGDQLLLYTDGLVEARDREGRFFTAELLGEFLERQAAAGLPAPETLRRLRHAVLGHHDGRLQDDATAVLVQWRRDGEAALLPQTV